MSAADPFEAISRAYQVGPWLRGYVKGKLRGDPVFDAARSSVEQLMLPVVDLGCGLGLLGMWLRAHDINVPYRGCDLGGWKIVAGNKAAQRLGLSDFMLEEADMCRFPLESPRIVCAFDVLHYLPAADQEMLVLRLAGAARQGSVVLLRTGVRGCGWRTFATTTEEWWTRLTGWIRGGRINFPQLDELVATFEREGCRVDGQPLWGKTPFSSHWLRVCARD